MATLQHLSSSIIAPLPSQLRSCFLLRRRCRLLPSASAAPHSHQADNSITRRQLVGGLQTAATAAAISLSPLCRKALAVEDPLSEWERVFLPIDPGVVLLDIAFVPDDPSHGFLLGTRQTLLETKDGGNTWAPRSIASAEDEDFNYRFNCISFKGNEGWIIGKPAILLYTADAGNTWKRIPLSSQLPGDMHHLVRDSRSSNKEERPRLFDSKAKKICWDGAKKIPGRDPERWRMDAAGNIVCKRLHTCNGCLCYEYDHIIPFSKGGESVAENCQILQTRVNRLKSDKNDIDQTLLEGYSCDITFSDEQLDIIEMAVYGSVIRPERQCMVGSISSLIDKYSSRDHTERCNLAQQLSRPHLHYVSDSTSRHLSLNEVFIKATGEKGAELVTDQGAIYVTSNGGYNWKAAIQETVSATLNRTVSSGISGASYYTGTFSTVNRSPEGKYIAVSSRGNFFLTWEPGQAYWQPHNRAVARRIQNMGWRADGGLWLLARGGGLYLSKGTGISEEFEEIPVQSRGFGILDVGYRSEDEAWAAGGSGVLLKTTNSGKTWIRDRAADNIAANLYSVKFINDKQGFVLGNDGVLLKFLG